jgi:hypothetical protein
MLSVVRRNKHAKLTRRLISTVPMRKKCRNTWFTPGRFDFLDTLCIFSGKHAIWPGRVALSPVDPAFCACDPFRRNRPASLRHSCVSSVKKRRLPKSDGNVAN